MSKPLPWTRAAALVLIFFSFLIHSSAALAIEPRTTNATWSPINHTVSDFFSLPILPQFRPPTALPREPGEASSTINARMASIPPAPHLPLLDSRAGTIKVMVVGDSISQGHEGDWTWRYRLWQWFQDQGVSVDFVGPYSGTRSPDAPEGPSAPSFLDNKAPSSSSPPASTLAGVSGGYAVGVASNFDHDHFAVWGRQAAEVQGEIKAMVLQYTPDYLLIELGFNDMGWFISDAPGTLASMQNLVAQARAAKPDIKMAIANVPQRPLIGGREDLPIKTSAYNALLAAAIPSWSSATSPIHLVKFAETYQCGVDSCPAGYDSLHPNAIGEYQIAQAFAQTLLDDFGIGQRALTIGDVPQRPTPIPSNFKAVSSGEGITVTWDAVYGAFGYVLRSRVPGLSNWSESALGTTRWDTTWALSNATYEFQVRTDNHLSLSDWSATSSAVATPQVPSSPLNVVTHATSTGVDISWEAPTGKYSDSITQYVILFYDASVDGAWLGGYSVTGTSAHIDGLVPGDRYNIIVEGWNTYGGGWPAVPRGVVIGAGTPSTPTSLLVTSLDDLSVQLDWCGSPGAAGYRVWIDDITIKSSEPTVNDQYISTDQTTYGVGILFPGVWNYAFCVTAINGDLESGLSNCVVAPKLPAGPAGGGATCHKASDTPGPTHVPTSSRVVPTGSTSIPTQTPTETAAATSGKAPTSTPV